MIRLKIKNYYYKVIGRYNIRESSREVKFSNLKIDFTNKTIQDLPLKYQEVQLLELDDEYNIIDVIYTGYVNNFTLPNMKNRVEYRELEIELLSPLAMATLRTIDAVGTYNLQPLIREIVAPLINDGFVLKELNVGNNQITVNYLTETVESSLNKLSNKFNFWWYVDKNKNIYINSIDSLIARNPKIIYDDDNKINGLIDVIPSIEATDYCNTVNFTNLRLYVNSSISRVLYEDPITSEQVIYYATENPIFTKYEINSGDEIVFDIPFDITAENYKKNYDQEHNNYEMFEAVFYNASNVEIDAYIKYQNGNVIMSNNVSIDEQYSDINTFVFVRDSFFKNLIVGLKYNGIDKIIVNEMQILNALMWTKIKISNNNEIYKNKGIISQTGIVEKQINMSEQWKTHDEIIDIANSYIKKSTSKVEQVKLNVDKDLNVNVGDSIKINKPCFLIDDTYIITDKSVNYNKNVVTWQLNLRNTNILENYVDLFREKETEEQNNKNYSLITSDYSEEEIKESYEVIKL